MDNDSSRIDDLEPFEFLSEDINNLLNDEIATCDHNQYETFLAGQSHDPSSSLDDIIRADQYIDDLIRSLQSNECCASLNSPIPVEQLTTTELTHESLPVLQDSHENSSKSFVPLSGQVAVSDSKPSKLRIVFPLETTYRARYKSDYFPQSGAVRRPRYIADRNANHYITLQLPLDYSNNMQDRYIRVALITVFIKGQGHYYSPYKFQKDNTDLTVSDENPIYVKVDNNLMASATFQLHLVLIKSKLDQLNYVQPLKPFCDNPIGIEGMIDKQRLTPKELINKYQLDKSHLAFTLCTKTSISSYQPDPETTVFSSIISETGTSKRSTESNTVSSSTHDTDPRVHCPHCSSSFNYSAGLQEYQRNQNHLCHGSQSSSKEARKNYTKKARKT